MEMCIDINYDLDIELLWLVIWGLECLLLAALKGNGESVSCVVIDETWKNTKNII